MGFTATAEIGTELFAGAEAGGAVGGAAALTGGEVAAGVGAGELAGGGAALAGDAAFNSALTDAFAYPSTVDYGAGTQYAANTAGGVVSDAGGGGGILSSGGDLSAMTGGGSGVGAGLTPTIDAIGGAAGGAGAAGGITGGQILSGLSGGLQAGAGLYALSTAQKIGQMSGQSDPFAAYRPQYAGQLASLMNNPNSVSTLPQYQFNLQQGLQAMQAQQASQGRLVSGGALMQGQQFGQQLAGQSYQQQLNTLASLSGATQSPSSGAAAQSGLLTGQISGLLGGTQALTSGFGNLYSSYNQPSPTV